MPATLRVFLSSTRPYPWRYNHHAIQNGHPTNANNKHRGPPPYTHTCARAYLEIVRRSTQQLAVEDRVFAIIVIHRDAFAGVDQHRLHQRTAWAECFAGAAVLGVAVGCPEGRVLEVLA